MNSLLLGYSPDYDLLDEPVAKASAPGPTSREAVRFDTETAGNAVALLNAPGGAALASVLGGLIRKAATSAGGRVRPAVGAVLVGQLRGAARQVLPALGVAPGTPQPAAARSLGRFFGIELEGLSPEDQEFEAARRFAQLTQQAAREAAIASPRLSPAAAADWAITRAARLYAPGWARLRAPGAHAPQAQPRTGATAFFP